MSGLKNILENRRFTQDMQNVVISMQELSVLEMQSIRETVLQAREYMSHLLDIFHDVRQAEHEEVESQLKEKEPEPKTALILLTQDHRFSDTNVGSVVQSFLQAVQESLQTDLFVIGQVGHELVQASTPTRPVQYLALPEKNGSSNTDLNSIFAQLSPYKQLVVYHGQFENLLQQGVSGKSLTGQEALQQQLPESSETSASPSSPQPIRHFLFEPSLPTIIEYFEQEVLRNLLQQALSESRLAHIGSRVQTLEQARYSIDSQLQKLRLGHLRAIRRAHTKEQQQRLAGISLWS